MPVLTATGCGEPCKPVTRSRSAARRCRGRTTCSSGSATRTRQRRRRRSKRRLGVGRRSGQSCWRRWRRRRPRPRRRVSRGKGGGEGARDRQGAYQQLRAGGAGRCIDLCGVGTGRASGVGGWVVVVEGGSCCGRDTSRAVGLTTVDGTAGVGGRALRVHTRTRTHTHAHTHTHGRADELTAADGRR
jgi:hypothetical protein